MLIVNNVRVFYFWILSNKPDFFYQLVLLQVLTNQTDQVKIELLSTLSYGYLLRQVTLTGGEDSVQTSLYKLVLDQVLLILKALFTILQNKLP